MNMFVLTFPLDDDDNYFETKFEILDSDKELFYDQCFIEYCNICKAILEEDFGIHDISGGSNNDGIDEEYGFDCPDADGKDDHITLTNKWKKIIEEYSDLKTSEVIITKIKI
jgi:hypothetical protein